MPCARRRAGFTLVEVLAALAILSSATYIMVSMFQASRGMARENALRSIAGSVAREHLVSVTQQPEMLAWPDLRPGVLQEVMASEAASPDVLGVPIPSTMPSVRSANRVQQNLYDAFSTNTYVLLPSANATFVEVISKAEYQHKGRTYAVAMTSALPRETVERAGGTLP